MLSVYPAIFHNEDGFWVEFPDLPGCQSSGSTLAETIELSEEALGLFLASLAEDGKTFPEASALESIHTDDGFVSYISTDVSRYFRNTRAVRKTLSIPEWMAEEADRRNISLSRVLQDGLRVEFGY